MSIAQYNASPPTVQDGKIVELQADVNGNVRIALTGLTSSGADATSNQLAWATRGGSQSLNALIPVGAFEFNGTTWDRAVKANATARLLSAAASTNATSVKASAGNLFKIVGTQVNAAARYLKLYNKASAPTVGTDTPIWTFYLPPTAVGGGLFTLDFGAQPLYFATGIAYALTTAAADADTGALTAGDVIAMNIAYS
jgi:hypothetical protein